MFVFPLRFVPILNPKNPGSILRRDPTGLQNGGLNQGETIDYHDDSATISKWLIYGNIWHIYDIYII